MLGAQFTLMTFSRLSVPSSFSFLSFFPWLLVNGSTHLLHLHHHICFPWWFWEPEQLVAACQQCGAWLHIDVSARNCQHYLTPCLLLCFCCGLSWFCFWFLLAKTHYSLHWANPFLISYFWMHLWLADFSLVPLPYGIIMHLAISLRGKHRLQTHHLEGINRF